MMRKKINKSHFGQSVTEYAVLLALVAAALMAMQVYLKRGIQGRIRDLADQISPTHYEQGQTTSNFTTEQVGQTTAKYTNGVADITIPESWEDSAGNEHNGEEVKRWGNETTRPETQEIGQ
jgi:Flp pilus assembly pilin Flp